LLPYCWFKEKKKIKRENKPKVLALQYRWGIFFLLQKDGGILGAVINYPGETLERDLGERGGKGPSSLERKDLQGQGKTEKPCIFLKSKRVNYRGVSYPHPKKM